MADFAKLLPSDKRPTCSSTLITRNNLVVNEVAVEEMGKEGGAGRNDEMEGETKMNGAVQQ